MCSNLLSTHIPVKFRWVPSHVGIPQNELADRLADRGAAKLGNITSSIAGQPPIPHTVAKGMLKSAIWSQQTRRWMETMAKQFGCDHLSRIQLGVRPVELFFVGSRHTQTTLARLRFGHVSLNAHLFRFKAAESSSCACEEADETVSHFLLHCHLYDNQRHNLLQSIGSVLPVGVDPTENILLGGSDFLWGPKKYKVVAEALCEFIKQTKRF